MIQQALQIYSLTCLEHALHVNTFLFLYLSHLCLLIKYIFSSMMGSDATL